mgnify:CR=1 FL=1
MDNIEIRQNVMESAFALARAMHRGPRRMEHDLPPAVERTLLAVSENDGLSSGQLCELLDIRPSSASELTDKMAEKGLLEKKADEADKRINRIFLTELGKAQAARIAEVRSEALSAFSACFTDEEAAQFADLANRLSAHLRTARAEGAPENEGGCFKDRGHGCGGHGHGPHGPHGGEYGHGGPRSGGHGLGMHHHPMHRH